ncbi:MAG: MaoC family dehydratase [Chromatiales bacterium]|nr:MaoC family dehydratase [Chromatiales bacterium]
MNTSSEPFLLSNAHTFVGREMALTDWVFVDQIQANVFGEVTRWTPWMHSDPKRCEEESPYGGTIMHGFMMVSLLTHFLDIANLRPTDAGHSLNYGMDKVRVLRPVVIGDGVQLRDRITLLDVTDKGEGRRLFKTGHSIEVKDSDKPAVYVEYLNYWYP